MQPFTQCEMAEVYDGIFLKHVLKMGKRRDSMPSWAAFRPILDETSSRASVLLLLHLPHLRDVLAEDGIDRLGVHLSGPLRHTRDHFT